MIDLQDTLELGVLDTFLSARGDEPIARYAASRTTILEARSIRGDAGLRHNEDFPFEAIRTERDEPFRALRMVHSSPAEPVRTPQQWAGLARRESNEDRCVEIYQEGVCALPDSAEMASLAAPFLEGPPTIERRAEDLHFRAVVLAPTDSAALTNYANFLTDVRQDHDAAAAMCVRALEIDPDDADQFNP